MGQKTYREVLIFVTGTTPQIVTETLYGLTQHCKPPVFPDEIHIITTASGKQRIEEELLAKGRLSAFFKEFDLSPMSLSEDSVHIIKGQKGQFLDDIREGAHNEALGDFIAGFIRPTIRRTHRRDRRTGHPFRAWFSILGAFQARLSGRAAQRRDRSFTEAE